MKRKSLLLGIFSLLVVALIGCGTSETGSGSTGSGSGEKSLLDEIQERGTIIIATSGNNAPMIYPDEKNELVGVDADWAQIVADHLGVEIDWRRMDFKGIMPGLMSGHFDIGFSGFSVTEERKESFDFSERYALDESVAVFSETIADINSPYDIEGKIVGAVSGSSHERVVQEIGGYKELKQYQGIAESFEDLKQGRVEVIIGGRIAGGHWLNKEGAGFKMSEEGTNPVEVAVIMNKNQPELMEAINEAIQNAKAEGKYDEIAMKWIGTTFSE